MLTNMRIDDPGDLVTVGSSFIEMFFICVSALPALMPVRSLLLSVVFSQGLFPEPSPFLPEDRIPSDSLSFRLP